MRTLLIVTLLIAACGTPDRRRWDDDGSGGDAPSADTDGGTPIVAGADGGVQCGFDGGACCAGDVCTSSLTCMENTQGIRFCTTAPPSTVECGDVGEECCHPMNTCRTGARCFGPYSDGTNRCQPD